MSFDFSKIRKVSTAAELLKNAVQALDTIAKLTANTTDDRAVAILHAVTAVIETVRAGFAGTVTPEQVRAELEKMTNRLAASDTGADQALTAKFKR